MKRLLPMLGLLISLNCFGQFPEYSSNVTDLDIGSSLLIEKYDSKYPFILAYSQPSFWSKRQYNSVLTFDGKSWKLAKWSYELRKNKRPKKSKSESFNLDSQVVIEFFLFIEKKGFYTFAQDSLNWNKKDKEGGNMLVQSIMDGTSDKFEMISACGHRIYTAYEPEQLQKFIYNQQRKNFIECRNKFLELENQKSLKNANN